MGGFEKPLAQADVLKAVTPFLMSQMGSVPAGSVSTGGGSAARNDTTGLFALGGVVFSKLRAKQDEGANWQSTYVPPAPPKPAAPAAAPVTPATTSAVPVTGDPLTDPLPDDAITADDVVTVDPPATV